MIDEQEGERLTAFFEDRQGEYGNFAFDDPWETERYMECSLVGDEMKIEVEGEGRIRTHVEVKENRL